MSASTTAHTSMLNDELPPEEYRAVSTPAVASLILGTLSVLTFVAGYTSLEACLLVCPIPVIGALLGWRALRSIKQMPDELTGRPVALVGVTLSVVFLVGGIAYAGFIYITEVPDGYERVSFRELKPSDMQLNGGQVIPPEIRELEGKKVFIKGYIRSDSITSKRNIGEFLFVRDNEECCFGDISKVKYYDRILVSLVDGLRTNYSTGVFRLGGVLKMKPEHVAFGPRAPVFYLEADHVQ